MKALQVGMVLLLVLVMVGIAITLPSDALVDKELAYKIINSSIRNWRIKL